MPLCWTNTHRCTGMTFVFIPIHNNTTKTSFTCRSMSRVLKNSDISRQVFYRAMLHRAWLCHSMSSVSLSVRPSVCNVQVPWSHRLEYFVGELMQREHPKLGWNRTRGGVRSVNTCNISETVQDRTKVTMTDYWGLIGSRIRAFDSYQWWSWTAETSLLQK